MFVLGPEEGRAVLEGKRAPVALWVVEGAAGEMGLVAFPGPGNFATKSAKEGQGKEAGEEI